MRLRALRFVPIFSVGVFAALLLSSVPANAVTIYFWRSYPTPLPAYWNCGDTVSRDGWSVQACTRLSHDSAGRVYYVPTIIATNTSRNSAKVINADTSLLFGASDHPSNFVPGAGGPCAGSDFSPHGSAACTTAAVLGSRIAPGGCTNVQAGANLILPNAEIGAHGRVVLKC
jgi:hypothetical protein